MISTNEFYKSGRQKFEAKDFQGALKDYTKAISQSEDPFLYSERGVVYYHLKMLHKSLEDMNHAVDLEPDNPYRYSSRAYIKDALGDTEGAVADYEKAVELDPQDSIALNNLGLLLEKMGYKDKAKNNFKRADQLEGVDQLLEKVRQEQRELAQKEKPAGQTSQIEVETEQVHAAPKKTSFLAFLSTTFTTKKGFEEYIQFVRNGFKSGL